MKSKILVVDDDPSSAELLQATLGAEFDIVGALSGAAALQAAAHELPAVILMDVEMPGMNGYDACRALRAQAPLRGVTVFFVSANAETENRLAAYESGGDDFVSKPFSSGELQHKIKLALAQQASRKILTEKVQQVTTIAMLSMREAADSGITLGYLSEISRQTDLATIAATTLDVMGRFRVAGAVQLRDGTRHYARNSAGACSAVEETVLTGMAQRERIVDLAGRTAFNYQRASIIVYDMPVENRELYGRLKDTVVKMAEALDVHLSARETLMAAIARSDALLAQLQKKTEVALALHARLETMQALHGEKADPVVDAALAALCAAVADVPLRQPPVEAPAAGVHFNSVELF